MFILGRLVNQGFSSGGSAMKKLRSLLSASTLIFGVAAPATEVYHMRTAEIAFGELRFASVEDFDEALRVGFFRIKRPPNVSVNATRTLGRTFPDDIRYSGFGMIDIVNGYLLSKKSQGPRFQLDRDHWEKVYSPEIQAEGKALADVGITILRAILRKFEVPPELWFQATSGAALGEGGQYLAFNHYDPRDTDKPFGLEAHTDWGYIAVLDSQDEGLEAQIDGEWRLLRIEEGFLTINFGGPLNKLLPKVNASLHRVITQTKKVRTSTVLFIDPRVGNFRKCSGHEDEAGMVWDWDPVTQQLVNGLSAAAYFDEKSYELHGEVSTGSEDGEL
jgi:hypothetical protein